MQVHMNEEMFQHLYESMTYWKKYEDWKFKEDRFEQATPGKSHEENFSYEWERIYWVGDHTASMILATSWIKEQGEDFELLWDLAEHWNGDSLGWAILTNYIASNDVFDKNRKETGLN